MDTLASVTRPLTRERQNGQGPAELARRPTREEAEEAVRTLIAWAGDDPSREGLRDTPGRVVEAYEEFFAGYDGDPYGALDRTFDDVQGYDDLVMVRDIRIESHCEHHILPIIGVAHVAYFPSGSVVGISKLARVVDLYAKRLQTQETMTAQIANAIEEVLKPRGVAIMIDAIRRSGACAAISDATVSAPSTYASAPPARGMPRSRRNTRSGGTRPRCAA